MRTAVLLANGVPPSLGLLSGALEAAELFVCADGGANAARAMGLVPRAIVGDMDSVAAATQRHFARLQVEFLPDPDTERTDLDKAIRYLRQRGGLDRIRIFGATAGRLDHVVGHLGLLFRYPDDPALILEDDELSAFVAGGEVRLDYPAGTRVSFFGVGGPVHGVSTENLRYPLATPELRMGGQDSISNEVQAAPAWVRIAGGQALFLIGRKPMP
jgi:thiamine pyrophosphokinase